MVYNIILFVISIGVFIGYNVITYLNFGQLPHISGSYYSWKEKGYPYAFLMGTWGYAVPIILIAQTPLLFLSGAALTFVGLTGDAKIESGGKLANNIHHIGAKLGVGLALLSEIIDYKMYWLAGITLALIFLFDKLGFKNNNYWLEIVAYVSIISCIFFKMIVVKI